MKRFLMLVTVALALAGAASRARAETKGVVKGRALFYNAQGNFCPSNRDCTGSTFLWLEANKLVPLPDTKIYIKGKYDALLGQGTTDRYGYYTISWYSWNNDTVGKMSWWGEHKEGIFYVRDGNGNPIVQDGQSFAITNGTTTLTPQYLPDASWGTSTLPNPLANVYEGAWHTWYWSLRYSNRMVLNFSNLTIRAFSSKCPTSCAEGNTNTVHLDGNAAYAPQARVMHEMGHIASYRASRGGSYRQAAGSVYCFGGEASPCGWFLTSAENMAASFEEGIATFFGDVALYWASARQPHTCLAAGTACATNSFTTEFTVGTTPGASCAAGEQRWPLSVDRYLRDVYDTNNDGETMARPYGEFFDTLDRFGDGRGDHQEDEPWCDDFWGTPYICNPDGRSAADFQWNFQQLTGVDTGTVRWNNCSP